MGRYVYQEFATLVETHRLTITNLVVSQLRQIMSSTHQAILALLAFLILSTAWLNSIMCTFPLNKIIQLQSECQCLSIALP